MRLSCSFALSPLNGSLAFRAAPYLKPSLLFWDLTPTPDGRPPLRQILCRGGHTTSVVNVVGIRTLYFVAARLNVRTLLLGSLLEKIETGKLAARAF